MTASQQPDAERAPLTSPAAAGSGSTGHDKAVALMEAAIDNATDDCPHDDATCHCHTCAATAILAALRAALAAGDPDVAEALDGRVETHTVLLGWPAAPRKERRFVTDWTEAP